MRGYLEPNAIPDSLAILPKPPTDDSAQKASDAAVYQATRATRGTPRWNAAARDANLKFPQAAGIFACPMDVPISSDQTPHLNMLLRQTLLDAGLSTYAAKNAYQRERPFISMGDANCTA